MPRNRTRRRSDANTTSSTVTPTPPRSKSGCWTCRIRRKRCDETQDETGACLACKRLDIECLGWGTKRPEWCRDKDALSQYKLTLKRKLCSRAGTRPSAASSTGGLAGMEAARLSMPTIEPHHDVTRAPSGESPASSESVADEEPDIGNNNNDLFDFPFSPSPHSTVHPLPLLPESSDPSFFYLSSQNQFIPHQPSPPRTQPQPLPRIASQLHNLLTRSALPAEYATIVAQVLDLHFFKSHALASKSPNANVEHEAARRAQYIDAELTRLANRSAFNSLFAGTTGFAFDPSSFLSLTPSHHHHGHPHHHGHSHHHSTASPYAPYSSPMTVWSPELIPDSMSTFSGSSAPTSPAAPLLAMASSSHHTPMADLFYDPVPQHQQPMYDTYLSIHPSTSQPQQFGSALGFGAFGALGLSNNDFLFNDYAMITSSSAPSASSNPAIGLLTPPPVIAIPSKVAPSPFPPSVLSHHNALPTPATPAIATQDSDPLQIHHETCTLLLQAVLNTASSSSYEFANPSHELEECLQRLTTKFTPLSHSLLASSPLLSPSSSSAASSSSSSPSSPSEHPLFVAGASQPSSEYLFGATVAGAMSTSPDRRAFFRGIVAAIESRTGGNECVAILDEAWRE